MLSLYRNLGAIFFIGLLLGCTNVEFSKEPVTLNSIQGLNEEQVVCDPFEETNNLGTKGLFGTIKYFPADRDEQFLFDRNVRDYLNDGIETGVKLFMSQLNVPDRDFMAGFPLTNGNVIRDQRGNVLTEWFGIQLETIIQLGPNDQEGEYRFGLKSDDGSILEIKNALLGYEEFLNFDGRHSSSLAESEKTVSLTRNTKLPIRVLYFQGPRYKLGLQLLWKREGSAREFTTLTTENYLLPEGIDNLCE